MSRNDISERFSHGLGDRGAAFAESAHILYDHNYRTAGAIPAVYNFAALSGFAILMLPRFGRSNFFGACAQLFCAKMPKRKTPIVKNR